MPLLLESYMDKQLDENQTYDASKACPICDYQGNRKKIVPLQSSPEINLLKCPRCKGASASRMPTESYLNEYYQQYYQMLSKFVRLKTETTCNNANRFAKHIRKHIPKNFFNHKQHINILDFGGGDGSLSKTIAQLLPVKNVTITIVEHGQTFSETIDNITINKLNKLEEVKEPQDFILASAILEHIPKITNTLRALTELLRSKGILYARTPFVAPIIKPFKHGKIGYPAHVHDLGPEFWNMVADTLSLNIEVLFSKPSVIETEIHEFPIRTTLAFILKSLANIQLYFSPKCKNPWWQIVGGWEVFMRSNH